MEILFSSYDNRILGTRTWSRGYMCLVYSHHIRSEKDALARALWLENHVSSETGLEFLDEWLSTSVQTKH